MTMYNTGNPVGSTAPKDLSDNAQVLDKLVVGTDPSVDDRTGHLRMSWAGMEYQFDNAQAGRQIEFDNFLTESAYVWNGDYAAGLTFTRRNQYTVRDGIAYRPVDTATLPFTTTGTWATDQTKFVAFSTEDVLRQDLIDPTQGAKLVANTLVLVDSLTELLSFTPDAYHKVSTKSYHAGFSRGGANFRWNPARPKTEHNGGTVVDPSKAFPADWDDYTSITEWFTPDGVGSGCWETEDVGGVYYPTQFGAHQSINNNQPAYWACATAAGDGGTVIFTPVPGSSYRMHWFFGFDNQRVFAKGAKIDLFKLSPTTGPTVLAASGNNAYYNGVYLNCLETNLPNVRTTFEDRSNAVWEDCAFVGFRDAAPIASNNGWGTYFKRSSNISLINCYFENNSQNDIAILDGSENIRIVSARGPALNINVEPNNSTLPIKNINIENSKISVLSLQENDLVNPSAHTILVSGCDVTLLNYDGAGAEFFSTAIHGMVPWPDALGRPATGSLKLNGALGVGSNLLQDPQLGSVSYNSDGSGWRAYTGSLSAGSSYSDVSTAYGRALRINPTNASGTMSLWSRPVSVNPGSVYLVTALSSANYPVGAGMIGLQMAVRWLDGSSSEIGATICTINRGAAGASTPVVLQTAAVHAPVGAVFARVQIGSTVGSATTASTDWYSVGLHPIQTAIRGAGMQDPMSLHQPVRGPLTGFGTEIPASVTTYRAARVGDRVENIAPVASGFSGWICTAAPATWKGYGSIAA